MENEEIINEAGKKDVKTDLAEEGSRILKKETNTNSDSLEKEEINLTDED